MELMTIADVCVALQVGRKTVYRMISKGNLPAPRKIGNFRQLYFVRADIEKKVRKELR